jgi:hypothetical protein
MSAIVEGFISVHEEDRFSWANGYVSKSLLHVLYLNQRKMKTIL